jgi:hypothetical protein
MVTTPADLLEESEVVCLLEPGDPYGSFATKHEAVPQVVGQNEALMPFRARHAPEDCGALHMHGMHGWRSDGWD